MPNASANKYCATVLLLEFYFGHFFSSFLFQGFVLLHFFQINSVSNIKDSIVNVSKTVQENSHARSHHILVQCSLPVLDTACPSKLTYFAVPTTDFRYGRQIVPHFSGSLPFPFCFPSLSSRRTLQSPSHDARHILEDLVLCLDKDVEKAASLQGPFHHTRRACRHLCHYPHYSELANWIIDVGWTRIILNCVWEVQRIERTERRKKGWEGLRLAEWQKGKEWEIPKPAFKRQSVQEVLPSMLPMDTEVFTRFIGLRISLLCVTPVLKLTLGIFVHVGACIQSLPS